MVRTIIKELRSHIPFTILGAFTGVIIVVIFQRLPARVSYNIFYIFHPIHVFLSVLVTASMYELHKCGMSKVKCNILILLIIGYAGSIGIATLSDSIIPYLGEILLDLPNREIHLGFIERWWLINPLAILGVVVAYFRPSTKFPHFGHVLLSTWASLFHIIMAIGASLGLISYFVIFVFVFFAVWLPCCISDIAFPLVFVKEGEDKYIK
jgi:hypothetical protein